MSVIAHYYVSFEKVLTFDAHQVGNSLRKYYAFDILREKKNNPFDGKKNIEELEAYKYETK